MATRQAKKDKLRPTSKAMAPAYQVTVKVYGSKDGKPDLAGDAVATAVGNDSTFMDRTCPELLKGDQIYVFLR